MSVRSIPMLPERRRVRSDVFGPFPRVMVVLGFVRVLSVHSRAPLVSAESYGCVRSIPVNFVSRIRSSAFGPFQCAIGVDVLVPERSVHSR